MIWILAGVGLLLVVWLVMRGFVAANPSDIVRGLRWAAFGLGGLLVLVLVVTGRLGPALALAAGLAPLLMRWRPASGPTSPGGDSSEVETEWLRMSLDHDTGRMEGTVRRGPFQGRRLAELGRDELLELWRTLRADDEASASLLESWLDNAWPDWRRGESRPPPRATRMTREEALQVLDLQPGASPEEIRAAHRRLMLKVHPDQGGSTWLAARLNEARDVLLGEGGESAGNR
ncbi:MAG: DnaJ domain-containing protein [Rhodospirillales bacterium]|nr:DnaJ domain-containing protein [Rhodospirillales bacterium]